MVNNNPTERQLVKNNMDLVDKGLAMEDVHLSSKSPPVRGRKRSKGDGRSASRPTGFVPMSKAFTAAGGS